MTTQQIKIKVEQAIPLSQTCEAVRQAQIEARAAVRVLIEEIVRQQQEPSRRLGGPYEPREQLK